MNNFAVCAARLRVRQRLHRRVVHAFSNIFPGNFDVHQNFCQGRSAPPTVPFELYRCRRGCVRAVRVFGRFALLFRRVHAAKARKSGNLQVKWEAQKLFNFRRVLMKYSEECKNRKEPVNS